MARWNCSAGDDIGLTRQKSIWLSAAAATHAAGSPMGISAARRAVGYSSRTRMKNCAPAVPGIHWSAMTSGTSAPLSRSRSSAASAVSGDVLEMIR